MMEFMKKCTPMIKIPDERGDTDLFRHSDLFENQSLMNENIKLKSNLKFHKRISTACFLGDLSIGSVGYAVVRLVIGWGYIKASVFGESINSRLPDYVFFLMKLYVFLFCLLNLKSPISSIAKRISFSFI